MVNDLHCLKCMPYLCFELVSASIHWFLLCLSLLDLNLLVSGIFWQWIYLYTVIKSPFTLLFDKLNVLHYFYALYCRHFLQTLNHVYVSCILFPICNTHPPSICLINIILMKSTPLSYSLLNAILGCITLFAISSHRVHVKSFNVNSFLSLCCLGLQLIIL